MNRSVVLLVGLVLVGVVAEQGFAQCQGGGGGGSRGGSSGGGMMSGGGSATTLSGPGSWAYDQMLGQAYARQMALQAYQKRMEDQARRADALAKRQYFAAQRREQKAKTPTISSPSNLIAANSRSLYTPFSASQSLDILPSR